MSQAYSPSEIKELEETYGRFCDQAAVVEITGLSRTTINRLVAKGELPRYRPGKARAYRYRTAEVARLLKAE